MMRHQQGGLVIPLSFFKQKNHTPSAVNKKQQVSPTHADTKPVDPTRVSPTRVEEKQVDPKQVAPISMDSPRADEKHAVDEVTAAVNQFFTNKLEEDIAALNIQIQKGVIPEHLAAPLIEQFRVNNERARVGTLETMEFAKKYAAENPAPDLGAAAAPKPQMNGHANGVNHQPPITDARIDTPLLSQQPGNGSDHMSVAPQSSAPVNNGPGLFDYVLLNERQADLEQQGIELINSL